MERSSERVHGLPGREVPRSIVHDIEQWGQTMWLVLRVHADAFRLDPETYLRAIGWKLRGLKVRSRNAIAPLTGRSRHAYHLWIRRAETSAASDAVSTRSTVPILPVIDCRHGISRIEETLASLENQCGLPPVTIGGPPVTGATRIDHISELSRWNARSGVWLCPLFPGDQIAPDALATYAAAATTASDTRVIYADDDLLAGGTRQAPHFKPQWNPDLFQHHDYLTGASIILARDIVLMDKECWVKDIIAQAVALGGRPLHVPRVLHHRQRRPAPVVPGANAEPLAEPLPLVSVIIPTRNHLPLLRKCIQGLKSATYAPVELIVIDNDSSDPATLDYLREIERDGAAVLHVPGAFNYSRLNNAAVRGAKGEYLCFLNNDIEMIDEVWLEYLVRQAMRPEIGAVGARLLYPDGTIQHAGVFTGIGGGAGHAHRFQREGDPGYFQRARLPQQVSAVTAACLVVARVKFLAVGGFDEVDFPVAFNDVDLCLKLNARGWQAFYEPRATLIHHESKSRGSDSSKAKKVRFSRELAALKRKWNTDLSSDPYHHPQLSRFSEQFLVAV